jgi:Gelsolin repeat
MVVKEIYNFSQDSLDPRGIYLLDFDSEAFIWIGKSVKQKDKIASAFQMALHAMKVVHSRGNDRLKLATVSMLHQAFEP